VVLLALTTHGALSAEQTRPAASEKSQSASLSDDVASLRLPPLASF
jgi:hypothetical protein